MIRIRRFLYQIRLKLLYITNYFFYCFVSKKKKLYLVSSRKYKNKVKEDLLLQRAFLKNHYACKIVSWEDDVDQGIHLLRSVWGYHLHVEKFVRYIKTHDVILSRKLIFDNMSKKKQYELLEKYRIN